jgi:uncharacterized protein YegP (UPF0339 family)
MTRSTQLLMQAVSATKRRAGAGARPEPASMSFLVFEDNAGGYRWTIVAASGETLAQSSRFASYEEAERAARIVRSGAGSAPFEDRAGDSPVVDLVARRDAATVRDDLDAERWLDEGGSFSSEAVTRWQARR